MVEQNNNNDNTDVYVVAHNIENAGEIDTVPKMDTDEHDVIFTPVKAVDAEDAMERGIKMMLDVGLEFKKSRIVETYDSFHEFLEEEREQE